MTRGFDSADADIGYVCCCAVILHSVIMGALDVLPLVGSLLPA
jgi:hypothetical protein